jgi:hypothetical protein
MTTGHRGPITAELSDEDLIRELTHLYDTRMDALRHAPLQAFGEHTVRTAELETEYLRRRPAREIDPNRSRDGARGRD